MRLLFLSGGLCVWWVVCLVGCVSGGGAGVSWGRARRGQGGIWKGTTYEVP
ncbi:MAG: hypothetical protein KDA77_21740 [Planctomycetaceae bacterium]|nr:hypothetical protein [Planctomycetaceae bacterium]